MSAITRPKPEIRMSLELRENTSIRPIRALPPPLEFPMRLAKAAPFAGEIGRLADRAPAKSGPRAKNKEVSASNQSNLVRHIRRAAADDPLTGLLLQPALDHPAEFLRRVSRRCHPQRRAEKHRDHVADICLPPPWGRSIGLRLDGSGAAMDPGAPAARAAIRRFWIRVREHALHPRASHRRRTHAIGPGGR